MNALTRSFIKAVPRATNTNTRFMGTSTLKHPHALKEKTFKEEWMSDPATYPIVFVVGFACAMCSVFATQKLIRSPDVRIAPVRKNSPVRLD